MSKLKKMLLGLAFAQAGCLACGLWIQDRFLVSAASWCEDGGTAPATLETGTAAAKPAERTGVRAEAILKSMPMVRGITFLWIGGIQIGIAFLVLTHVHTANSETQRQSSRELMQRERELLRTRNAVVFGLAKLAEYRDPDTGQHLERIALYSNRLAAALRRDPRYRTVVTASFIKTIGISSALHDIGKVAIEDAILCKPGSLDRVERGRMQEHTVLAGECIQQIERHLGNSNFLQMAREIALCHHEHWDGNGYPNGLAGEAIPLAARIVAIADVYDALSSKRVYKDAYPHDRCVRMIRDLAGKHLDPQLVEAFLTVQSDFQDISQRFRDCQAEEDGREPKPTIVCIPHSRSGRDRSIEAVLDLADGRAERLVTAG